MSTLHTLRAADWLRVELAFAVGFHLLFGLTLAFAPAGQVVTDGARPVFEMAPDLLSIQACRLLWGALYVLAALLLAVLLRRPSTAAQLAAWLLVIPVAFIWLGTFSLAALNGRGSALAVVIWLTLLAWWATIAVRVGLGTTTRGD